MIVYLALQFFRHRSLTNEYRYSKLTSDPRIRSRTIIKEDIPSFYIPKPVSIQLQQPVRDQRSNIISKDEYRTGQTYLSPTVHSVNVRREAEQDRGGIQLNAINTGSMSPALHSKCPKSPRPPRKISAVKRQPPKAENLSCSLPQQRKVAVHKKKPDNNLGKLEFTLYYDQSFRFLQIYVIRGIKIVSSAESSAESSEGDVPPDVLVFASLSFNENQIWEQKTRMVKKSNDPQFNEKLEAHGITSAKLYESTLYFQLFNHQTNTLIGEVVYSLKELPANKLTTQTLPLAEVELDEASCSVEVRVVIAITLY